MNSSYSSMNFGMGRSFGTVVAGSIEEMAHAFVVYRQRIIAMSKFFYRFFEHGHVFKLMFI